MTTIDDHSQTPSNGWLTFAYASFGVSVLMIAVGIFFLPLDAWVKGYFAMAALLLIQACFCTSKAVRDQHESRRFINRIDAARTEKLLRDDV